VAKKINWFNALFAFYIAAVLVIGAATLARAAAF
jgi:hypothetical protein